MSTRESMPLAFPALRLLAFLLSAAYAAQAQQKPCLDRTIAVNVATESGVAVTSLGRDNFRATLHRQRVDIVSATYRKEAGRIGILIDSSNSMQGGAKWALAMKAAESVYASASSLTPFALLTFAGTVQNRVALVEGRHAVLSKLHELERMPMKDYKGRLHRTALLDALLEGLTLFGPTKIGDALFLITDGGENASRAKVAEVRKKLLAAGVRLFAFLLIPPPGQLRTPEVAAGPSLLRGLVDATGGELAIIEDATAVPATGQEETLSAARAMTAETNGFYYLNFQLREPPEKESSWKLEAVESMAPRRSHLRVVYPRLLAQCQ